MKQFILAVSFVISTMAAFAQSNSIDTVKINANKQVQIVEAACGQCKFGLPGKTCDLAVRIKGKSYFVDGTDIDSHGDAHGKNGFCNSINMVEVTEDIINNRFKATSFKLIPAINKK